MSDIEGENKGKPESEKEYHQKRIQPAPGDLEPRFAPPTLSETTGSSHRWLYTLFSSHITILSSAIPAAQHILIIRLPSRLGPSLWIIGATNARLALPAQASSLNSPSPDHLHRHIQINQLDRPHFFPTMAAGEMCPFRTWSVATVMDHSILSDSAQCNQLTSHIHRQTQTLRMQNTTIQRE